MQNKKRGYILIEWMICFFLLVLISCLTYNALLAWQHAIRASHQMLNYLLPLHLAGDMLRQDLFCCDQETLEVTHDSLVIMHKNKRIIWLAKDKRLVRSCSLYDVNSHRWRKPAMSLMATEIEKVTFKTVSPGCIEIMLNPIAQEQMVFIAGTRNGPSI